MFGQLISVLGLLCLVACGFVVSLAWVVALLGLLGDLSCVWFDAVFLVSW